MSQKFWYYTLLSIILSLITVSTPAAPEKNDLQSKMAEADRFFEATLFIKAIPLYQKMLPLISKDSNEGLLLRNKLAKCYFYEKQYEKIREVSAGISGVIKDQDPDILRSQAKVIFLMGAGDNHLHRYSHAIHHLERYLAIGQEIPLPHWEEARYELALAYFHNSQLVEAINHFEILSEKGQDQSIRALASIFLARIALAQNNPELAESILKKVENGAFFKEEFIPFCAFLHGECHFQRGNLQHAVKEFVRALPIKNEQGAEWYPEMLFHLGCCYLDLAEDPELTMHNQEASIDQAEEIFTKLTQVFPSDQGYLALGQCYLMKGLKNHDTIAIKKLETLLSDQSLLQSKESMHHGWIIRSITTPFYGERKKLIRQMTHESNRDRPYYGNAWYLRGLNELDQGMQSLNTQRLEDAQAYFKQAVSALEQAFVTLYPTNKKLAALALKYQAQAYFSQNKQESYEKGLQTLSLLLNAYRHDLYPLLESPDEVFYLQGFGAAKLHEISPLSIDFSVVENSLLHNVESYTRGEYLGESLKLLGTLYFQRERYEEAEKAFLDLAELHSDSSIAGEALYWASNCTEIIDPNSGKHRMYRKKVFETYPQSVFADEAYFHYYRYSDYLRGDSKALSHLKMLKQLFPTSPYQLNASYLIGFKLYQEGKAKGKRKSIQAAIDAYKDTISTFDQFYSKNGFSNKQLHAFLALKYRAGLDLALIYLDLAESNEGAKQQVFLENAQAILLGIHSEFSQPQELLSEVLRVEDSHFHFHEECQYLLAKTYILENQTAAAEKVLTGLLQRYQQGKVTRGYYFSRAWYLQGIIAIKSKEPELALQYFQHAEKAGKGNILSVEELLDLWIQQSHCYRISRNSEQAMLILSRVINFDAASSLRLKAMYLRAEVYEEQERYELARKQLEATAQKSGDWAIKAKEKLEKNYVYQ